MADLSILWAFIRDLLAIIGCVLSVILAISRLTEKSRLVVKAFPEKYNPMSSEDANRQTGRTVFILRLEASNKGRRATSIRRAKLKILDTEGQELILQPDGFSVIYLVPGKASTDTLSFSVDQYLQVESSKLVLTDEKDQEIMLPMNWIPQQGG